MNVRNAARLLDDWFPRRLAESWDNVGLLLGDESAAVERVMTCLTLTPDVAREAIKEKVDLVISHHPVFFKKIGRLTAEGTEGAAYQLARAGISLYSPHTSFDSGANGINEQIAQRLDLKNIKPLKPVPVAAAHKLVVFVPASDLEAVSSAIFRAGGGRIGEYSECSFRMNGTGTFFGSESANPTIGQVGRREEVVEHRMEVVVPASRLDDVIQSMIAAHSYETPAFDVYPLHSLDDVVGAGRVGELSDGISLRELALRVKRALAARLVEFVGPADRICRKIGIGCGAAAEFHTEAARQGCDVFITGEARFHDALSARDSETSLILAGHYATERFALETLAERLGAEWPGMTVWASRSESDPIQTAD
ncbi:Nif3-like dinuclear metal center hexameric protein [bacterium]|nr:Nif3-like dinuclear metal center hexameric protein [bacterium]